MKPTFEVWKYESPKTNQESLEDEFPPEKMKENVTAFVERVFSEENYIDSGRVGIIHQDPDQSKMCYKTLLPKAERLKRQTSLRSQKETGNTFLKINEDLTKEYKTSEEVYGFSDVVRSPRMIGKAKVIVTHPTGKKELMIVIAMEYLDTAVAVKDFNPETHSLPEDFSVELFVEKLTTYLKDLREQKGIWHKDIHEGNVMIDLETGNPVVIDFGQSGPADYRDGFSPYGGPVYGEDEEWADLDIENAKEVGQKIAEKLTLPQ